MADAALLATGLRTYLPREPLPEHLEAFIGPVRSVPPGVEWLERASLARRRSSFHSALHLNGANAGDNLVNDLRGEHAPTIDYGVRIVG